MPPLRSRGARPCGGRKRFALRFALICRAGVYARRLRSPAPPPAAGPLRSLPPGNSDLRRRVGVQSGRPDEIVPGEERKGCYYRVRSENGCRSRAATANPQRILKGTAVPLSRAPCFGSNGGFFASFLTGQKGRTLRQNTVCRKARRPEGSGSMQASAPTKAKARPCTARKRDIPQTFSGGGLERPPYNARQTAVWRGGGWRRKARPTG